MKAIETRFAGHRFRSRLEARWAVFFDSARIAWQYEPQGFEVGYPHRRYLPDFFLPETKTWVEVKPTDERLDMDLIRDCLDPEHGLPDIADSIYTSRGLLILGPIPRHDLLDLGSRVLHPIAQVDEQGLRCLGFLRFCYAGLTAEEFIATAEGDALSEQGGALVEGRIIAMTTATSTARKVWRIEDNRITDAYTVAREARFEFGETPIPSGRP